MRGGALWIAAVVVLAGCGGSESVHAVTGRLPVESELAERSTVEDLGPTKDVDHVPDSTSVLNVAAVFDGLMTTRIACGHHPWSCDLSTLTLDGSPSHRRFDELFASRRSAGIVASDDGKLRYRIDNVQTLTDSTVRVTTCITDDTVLVDANGWVFDDGLFSGSVQFELTDTSSGWRWSDDRVLTYTYGEDLCDLLD